MDNEDKRFLIMTVISPLVLWWVLIGRKKYGVPKGLK